MATPPQARGDGDRRARPSRRAASRCSCCCGTSTATSSAAPTSSRVVRSTPRTRPTTRPSVCARPRRRRRLDVALASTRAGSRTGSRAARAVRGGGAAARDDAGRRAARRARRTRSSRGSSSTDASVNDGTRRFLDVLADEAARARRARRCRTSRTGSRPSARRVATTRGSSWPPRPRRPGPLHDDKELVANTWVDARRGARAPPPRRDAADPADDQEPRGDRAVRSRPPRSSTRRAPRPRCRPSSRGSSPTATACGSCCPATRASTTTRSPTSPARSVGNDAIDRASSDAAVAVSAPDPLPDRAIGPPRACRACPPSCTRRSRG